MTVKELITKLKKCPKDAQVFAHLEIYQGGDGDSGEYGYAKEVQTIERNDSDTKVVISGECYPSFYGIYDLRHEKMIEIE
jgi:hypothetical protein